MPNSVNLIPKTSFAKILNRLARMLFRRRPSMRQTRKIITATQEAAALSDEKFKQGIINSVDYLVSKTNLIVAESQLLQAKYNLIFSYKILDFYTGIPLSL